MRLAILVLCSILSVTPTWATEQPFEFEYSRWSRITERLAGAGKFHRIVVRIRTIVPGKQIEPGKLVFTVLAKAGAREVRPDAEGFLTLPNDPALNNENPKVRANVAKSVEIRFGLQIRCRVTAGTAIPYSELAQCVDQMNDAIGEQAGMMSFMAPSAKGVRIRCGATCSASLPGGKPPMIAADKDGNIDLLHDLYGDVPNLTVTLTAPPTAVIPIIK